MKLNGNLVLNTGGQSQITNAIFDRVGSLPTFSASEAGRVVFLTTNKTYYFNNGTDAYVAFATGGNAAALQTEVDAIETALGSVVTGSGTFNAAALAGTAAAGATTLTEALTLLDAAVKGKDTLAELTDVTLGSLVAGDVLAWDGSKWVDSSALTDEVAARVAAVAAEQTARQAADATLTSGLAAEVTARQATDVALAAETSARIAGDASGSAAVAAETTARQAADALLQAAIDTETTARTSADTVLTNALAAETTARQDAVAAEAATRASADTALQTALTAEVTNRTAADATNAANILAETTARQAADLVHDTNIALKVNRSGDTMGGNLSFNDLYKVTGLATPTASGDAANKQYVDDVAAGLTWKNSAVAATTGNIALDGSVTAVDGVTLATGDRVLVLAQTAPAENGIYVKTASGAWTRTSDADTTSELANAALFVQGGTTYGDTAWVQTATVTTVGSSIVSFSQFSGGSVVTPGVGLSQSGSTFNVNLGAGIAELPTDGVGVDLYSGVTGSGLFLTTDGSAESTDNSAQLAVRLDGTTLTRSTLGVKVADATILRITTAENTIVAEGSTRAAADALLQSNLDTETTARQAADAALTAALAVEQTARLAGDASGAAAVAAEQTARIAADATLTSALATETTARTNADATLTTNLAAEVAARTSEDDLIWTEIVNIEDSIGGNGGDGSLGTTWSSYAGNYFNVESVVTPSIVAALKQIDTQVHTELVNTQDRITKMYFLYDGGSSTTHVVAHNLGQKYCNVTVVETATDEVIIPQGIVFNTANQLTVTFNAGVACKVIVMGLTPLGV